MIGKGAVLAPNISERYTMFDAILLASYGGPEKLADVETFLERILQGKRTSAARREAVVKRYERFGGASPLPEECRRFLDALEKKLTIAGSQARVYWGNLYAPPFMDDAFEKMEKERARGALVFPSSAFGSNTSCRRYVDSIRVALSKRSPHFASRLVVRHVPPFFETAFYQESAADSIREALSLCDPQLPRSRRLILFTAHSIPSADAAASRYRSQLLYACAKTLDKVFGGKLNVDAFPMNDFNFPSRALALDVAPESTQFPSPLRDKLRDLGFDAALAFQSRSGSPLVPWLEPDVNDFLRTYKKTTPALETVVVSPIGFFFENMETIFDLDVEAKETCRKLDITYRRAACCGNSERIIEAICRLSHKSPDEFPVCRRADKQCDLSCRLTPVF